MAEKLKTPGKIQSAITILFAQRLSLQLWHSGNSHLNEGHILEDDYEVNDVESVEEEIRTAQHIKGRPKNLGLPPADVFDYAPDDENHNIYWYRLVRAT